MHDDFIQRATSLVEQCFGAGALITLMQPLKDRERNVIVRLYLSGGSSPPSAIAKAIKRAGARGYTDLAGLRFLGTIPGMEAVAPRLYGHAEDGHMLLMADLGGTRSLEQVLDEGDASATLHYLTALARTKARMAGATRGLELEARFMGIRAQYPEAESLGREADVTTWRTGLSKVRRWADLLGLGMSRSFALDLQQLAQAFVEVAPEALVYSHGDPAPTNNHIAPDGTVRLLDFEYGTYRHLYYDLSGWNVLCPLPVPWVAAMVAEFRREIMPWLPAAASDTWHAREWATLCAYRAIAMLTWMPESALEADREWVGDWSVRSALISTALRLREVTHGVDDLVSLHDFAEQLAAALQSRWPELGDGAIKWPDGPIS